MASMAVDFMEDAPEELILDLPEGIQADRTKPYKSFDIVFQTNGHHDNTVMLKQANFMWVGTTPKTGAKFSPPDFGLFWGHGFGD